MADLQSKTLQERMIAILNSEHSLSYKPHDLTFQEACNKWLIETGTINGVDYSSIGLNKYSAKEALAIIRHKDNICSETLTELIHELGPYYPIHEYTAQEALNKKSAMLAPYSLSFDGSDDYISLESTVTLNKDNGSVSFWIKRNAIGANHGIFGHASATTINCYISTGGSERLYLRYGANYLISTTAIGTGWTHIVIVLSGSSSGAIYINGTPESSLVDNSIANNISFQVIACRASSGMFFDGKIDEFAVFDKALTQAEVTSLYASNPQNAGDAVGITNLVGYWKMDHGSGPVARDVSIAETLGNESLSNPSFSDGTLTSWTLGGPPDTAEVVSHDGHATAAHIVTSSANNGPYETSIVTAGKLYKVSFDVKVISGNVYLGKSASKVGGVNYTDSSWTSYTHYWIAEDSHFRVYNATASSEFYIDNISVKEVTNGNHGTINGATWTVH